MSTTPEAPARLEQDSELPDVWVVVAAMAALVCAATGMWSHLLASTTYLFDISGSSLVVSIASAAQIGATALALLPAGRLLDRRGPRLVLALGAGAAISAVVLAAGSSTADGAVAAIGLVVSVALLSTVTAAYQPVMQATIPGLVPASKTAMLVMLQFTAINTAQIIGPILGSSEIDGLHRGWQLLANGVLFLPLLAAGPLLARWTTPSGATASTPITSCLADIRSDRYLGLAYRLAFTIGLLLEPAITLGPALGEALTSSTSSAGTILTSFAVGSVVGGVRSRSLGSGLRPAAEGTIVSAVGFAAAAAAPSLLVGALGFGIAGAGFLWTGSALFSGAFGRVDPSNRGQMMAIWALAIFSGRIVASVGTALASDLASPQVALVVVAAGAAGLALLMRVRGRTITAD